MAWRWEDRSAWPDTWTTSGNDQLSLHVDSDHYTQRLPAPGLPQAATAKSWLPPPSWSLNVGEARVVLGGAGMVGCWGEGAAGRTGSVHLSRKTCFPKFHDKSLESIDVSMVFLQLFMSCLSIKWSLIIFCFKPVLIFTFHSYNTIGPVAGIGPQSLSFNY